ncbi:adenylyl cyclase X E isoform X2 [Drosophila grimshawi]|uniref:adenylyl cyclase X E isoform X2 n=1 Tax=Drosophila grimshawi TaxID=7222 RepID=UPI000C871630|nr:adenylyl cyclase X E isoform X2 [Drosophila grimshawi]
MVCIFDFSKEIAWERGYLKYCEIIYFDVFLYLVNATLTILVLSTNFNDKFVEAHSWIMLVTSLAVVFLMVVVDLILHLYHYYFNDWNIGTFYDTYVLLMIYLFLPVPFLKWPIILGCSVSIIYTIYRFCYTSTRYPIVEFFDATNMLHHLCLNIMGIFYRGISDIVLRSSFLDRYQYVMEDVSLRSARKREKLLLDSILPPQIARPFQADIRNRIALAGKRNRKSIQNMSQHIMAIESHTDVTILYADVVNYTHLTTTLTVNELVTLLHDLYGRFDVAAGHFNVQRIKFLGDCYYCVAGLTRPNPDHAKCCVELGHCMIANIREVQQHRNLNIDMRIGVHSGSILAGAIGIAKLQFDIWGNDVDIANLLESTGLPGHIHISQRTLDMMIDHSYEILPGTQEARDNPYLQSNRIRTYLIAGIDIYIVDYEFSSKESISFDRNSLNDSHNGIVLELRKELANLPTGAFHIKNLLGFFKKKQTKYDRPLFGFFLLHFFDPRLEYKYMRQPDYLLRYSVLLSWCVGISLIYIQMISNSGRESNHYFVVASFIIMMTLQLFITWYKKVCHWRYKKVPTHKFSSFSCLIFRIADFIERNLIIRMVMYMLTIISYYCVIALVLMDCDIKMFELAHIESKLYHYESDPYLCFQPWVLTDMVCLILGISMLFARIPWMVKIIVSTLEVATYLLLMLFQFEYIIHHSSTTNPYFQSEYAHSLILVITLISLYFMQRQAEFNNRVNFNWKMELIRKQQAANITNKSITILLKNILPSHVVNVYLTSLAKNELYHEDYKMVSVMFASLQKIQMDLPNLRILNEIICEFDQVLSHYRKGFSVDKIKIVGSTYMAACGLDPRFSSSLYERKSSYEYSYNAYRNRRLTHFAKENKSNDDISVQNEEVVFVLTAFALDLMRTVWVCNNVYDRFPTDRQLSVGELTIGISSGEVMAGVVGASQVHYDIWGNPVNMASRMNYTGTAGKIHLTKESALILDKYGIQCDYRGMTFVKGRGELPTYFVGIDENYEFKHTPAYAEGKVSIFVPEDNNLNDTDSNE